MTSDDLEGARGGGLSLVGLRGTGKSTVGRVIAERLSLPFIDADAALEARAGRPVAEIFAEGEPAFRDLESAVLKGITAGPPAVLATGGGAVLRPDNRQALRAFGKVVWLAARPETLADRLHNDPSGLAARPSLTGMGVIEEIAAVLEARAEYYRRVSDVMVDTDGLGPADVADAVLQRLDSTLA